MPSMFARVAPTVLTFYYSEEAASDAMKSKMKSLGWPDFWVDYPAGKKPQWRDAGNGLVDHVEGKEVEMFSFPLSEPTDRGKFSITHNPADRSITISLEGEFLCFSYTDGENRALLEKLTDGYVGSIRLKNDKGKAIKLPKDEYGMTLPVGAKVCKDEHGPLKAISVSVFFVDD